ncbi:hypothetical protein C1645_832224 [Glomus cerebriforme]|uniref:Uncharacterized protein n=1 Tax=Glomus cerebriforme TaxID=658196 RepID=A0A397SK10_9GLOM|nr:hypothetical protein C1645_832224 [Glomus cerebriforme]
MEYVDGECHQIGGLWLSKRIEEASKSQSNYLEISIGTHHFYEETNNIGLIYEITQGWRETIVPNTLNNYANIYTGCIAVNW